MICIQIRQFPLHPRFSLALVVLYMALSFTSLILWVSEAIKREIYIDMYKRILSILEIIEGVRDMGANTFVIAESSLKFIEGTEKSHSEAHEASTLAIRAVNDAVQKLAKVVIKPSQGESEEKWPTDS